MIGRPGTGAERAALRRWKKAQEPILLLAAAGLGLLVRVLLAAR